MDTTERDAASADLTPRGVLQRMERLQRAGVRYVALPKARDVLSASLSLRERAGAGASDEKSQELHASMTPVAPKPVAAPAPPSALLAAKTAVPRSQLALDERRAALSVLQAEVAGCARCAKLASTRKQTVFGVGNPQARLVFLGEAPGADEDAQGEPFVGRAGQLLTKIIEACTLRREDVYILNVLKCRPPENRNPLPDEVDNCRGYLDRQLEILGPEYICCLGSVAAKTLLETEASIGRLRGRFHDYRGIPVWCTYHPAYLLRNPAAKKDVWEDMKKLMATMGIDVEKRV